MGDFGCGELNLVTIAERWLTWGHRVELYDHRGAMADVGGSTLIYATVAERRATLGVPR
jgi:hypothetical protein